MLEEIAFKRQLSATKEQLAKIIDFLPDATLLLDRHKKVIAWNRSLESLTNIKAEVMIGQTQYASAMPYAHIITKPFFSLFEEEKCQERNYSFTFLNKEANRIVAEFSYLEMYLRIYAVPLYDDTGEFIGAIESIRDLTENKEMEKRLGFIATHDYSTGIPNRFSLEQRLDKVIKNTNYGMTSALLFIDIDNLNLINDSFGHTAGDRLLLVLTQAIKQYIFGKGELYRFVGDKFAVLMENTTRGQAYHTAEKLRQVIDREELCLTVTKTCFNITLSIGIAMIEDGGEDSKKILSFADNALYNAKKLGKNRIVFAGLNNNTIDQSSKTNYLISLIRNSLKEDKFAIFFQPVFDFRTNSTSHYEVLLRLRDANGLFIAPGDFIPVAENYGLMSQVDCWVVAKALSILEQYPYLRLFLNLSGTSLNDEKVLEMIEQQLSQRKINPSNICFEITETILVKDIYQAERWIRSIRKLGCQFALDDFGVGFSSFSYLRLLPVDYVKVDGSFINDIENDPTQQAIVKAISNVAQTLGKKTIAEFVEHKRTVEILKTLKIDYGQGYYLGKPAEYRAFL